MTEGQVKDAGSVLETGGISAQEDGVAKESGGGTVDYFSHRKVLDQKKRADAELSKARERLESLEQDRLQAEGKKDELITQLQSQLKDTQTSLKKKEASYAFNVVKGQLASEAIKAGCIDTDTLIKISDLSDLEVDSETFNVDQKSLKTVIDKVRKDKAYLFKKEAPVVVDKTPDVVGDGKTSLESLSLDEKIIKLAEIGR